MLPTLRRAWRIGGRMPLDVLPNKGPDVDLGKECSITGDPVVMLGMSTWTTGWTSCARWPGGRYRQGTVYWTYLRGTRVAAYWSDQTATHGGVTRRLMRARALIHQSDREHLRLRLETAGVLSVAAARARHGHAQVVGHAPASWRAWFDSLQEATSTAAASSPWRGRRVRVVSI